MGLCPGSAELPQSRQARLREAQEPSWDAAQGSTLAMLRPPLLRTSWSTALHEATRENVGVITRERGRTC